MRRHAAHIFNNRRRGEWNPLLLVMFALLTVAPSVLAAAPLNGLHNATQPQVVWQWLQSPEGAPTRDLLQQALSDCGVCGCPLGGAECGILNAPCELSQILRTHSDIDSPLAQLDSSFPTAPELNATEPIKPFYHPALCISSCPEGTRAFAQPLSSHEAAKLSGIRTNRFRN